MAYDDSSRTTLMDRKRHAEFKIKETLEALYHTTGLIADNVHVSVMPQVVRNTATGRTENVYRIDGVRVDLRLERDY